MFSGWDPEHKAYRSRAHLASIIALLGPPPTDLVARGRVNAKFFSASGTFTTAALLPASSLDATETTLEGHDKELFMQLMRRMMQWTPEHRGTAADLVRDPWICSH